MCQGGDFTYHNDTGGRSILGEIFEDENFILKGAGPGILFMVSAGQTQMVPIFLFFIVFVSYLHCQNGVAGWQNMVFGKVEKGMSIVEAMEHFGSRNNKTGKKITISDCGQLNNSNSFDL